MGIKDKGDKIIKTLKNRLKQLERKKKAAREETLQFKIDSIESHVKKKCELIPRIHPDFTLHNMEHVNAVISNLDILCQIMDLFSDENARRLSKYEIFLLLASAYLHDIGMILVEDEDKIRFIGDGDSGLSKAELSKKIREDHPERSMKYVLQNNSIFHTTTTESRHIGKICQGHGDWELEDNKYDDRPDPTNKKDYKAVIRIRFLIALLQLADELDTSCERAPDYIRKVLQDWSMDRISQFHWMKHYYTGNVQFGFQEIGTDKKVIITLDLEVPDELHGKRMKTILEDRILKELRLVNPIFRRYCDWSCCLSSIKYNINSALESTPEEVFRAYFVGYESLEILLIEDDPEWKENFKKALGSEGCGYSISFAHDKKSAIDKIKKEHYNMVVLDLHIPDEDGDCSKEAGYSVLRVIKECCPNRVVLVLSGKINAYDSKKIKKFDIINMSKSEFYGDAQNPPKKIIDWLVKENLHLMKKE